MSRQTTAYTLSELSRYFLKLGTVGFGGPPALVSAMHTDLVVNRKWLVEEDYKEGLALAQLAPGPLAAQLAIYIGYIHYGITGATLAGISFVLPSFLMVLALGFAYVRFEGLPFMQAVFYGVGATVISIITFGSYKLIRKTVPAGFPAGFLFLLSAAVTVWTEQEILWLITGIGVIYWLLKKRNILSLSVTQLTVTAFIPETFFLTEGGTLWKLALFFLKAGAFVFGSGLAIVPFLYGGVVHEYGWLSEQQFLDAVAVAMITPGPVVITVGFIGYLVAGLPGACVAALATFLPCYIFTVLPAPYFKKWGKNADVRHFVEGITIAAVGAIAGAVIVLARRQLTDVPSLLIASAALLSLIYLKKVSEPLLVLTGALAGILLQYVLTT